VNGRFLVKDHSEAASVVRGRNDKIQQSS